MTEERHISDGDLVALFDDALPSPQAAEAADHLRMCAICAERSGRLQRAGALYSQIHNNGLLPALAPASWPALRLQQRRFGELRWMAIALAACTAAVILVMTLRRPSESSQVTQLLVKAQNLATQTGRRKIQIRANGAAWVRSSPSRREGMELEIAPVRTLFVQASYDWNEPLSVRSFATWRRALHHRRDHVSQLKTTSGAAAYLVRTDTADSSLHSASLTLRSKDLLPMEGTFRFGDGHDVTIEDAGEASAEVKRPTQNELPRETPVTPADELRVLAALDEIGADVNESIVVERNFSQNAVIVTGIGVMPTQQAQIRRILMTIPRTAVQFLSHAPQRSDSQAEPLHADEPDPKTLSVLESRAGGQQEFDNMTAIATESSDRLLARAHMLSVLAGKFPTKVVNDLKASDRSVLAALRRRQKREIENNEAKLENALHPLMLENKHQTGTELATHASWQAGAGEIYARARSLDEKISHLLGGAYSPQRSEAVLRQLNDELEELRTLARE